MVKETTTLQQTIFKTAYEPIQVTLLNEADLDAPVLIDFLKTASHNNVGLAAVYGAKGVLSALALSSLSHALFIRFSNPSKGQKKRRGGAVMDTSQTPRVILADLLLCNMKYRKLAFDGHNIAAALHFDYGLLIRNAVDLQSVHSGEGGRSSPDTYFKILGPNDVDKKQVKYNFFGHGLNSGGPNNTCLRAWACCKSESSGSRTQIRNARRLDTMKMRKKQLDLICKFVRDAQRIEALKPVTVKNNVKTEFSYIDGALQLECTHFANRIRRSETQNVVVKAGSAQGGSEITVHGRARGVRGKNAVVSLNKAISSAYTEIHSVQTFGRGDPSPADTERIRLVLSIFCASTNVLDQPLAQCMFSLISHPARKRKGKHATPAQPSAIRFTARPLNASQQEAVQRVLSDDPADRICLIHGPPGTGKTTVISACVSSILARSNRNREDRNREEGIWLVAQSNVAVKNIAEKLAEVGLNGFKLLVSKDFHFEWHEHLYETIERNVLRSDTFKNDIVESERMLAGSRVILCTLSMFSCPRFSNAHFHRLVPITHVLVDEASQIELGCYLPLLHHFGHTIKKLAFIGDDKQLAPYGQDDIGNLRSIFESQSLRGDAIFLDTQYRMPEPIGGFISKHVYNGRLKTVHEVHDPRSCRFVDVSTGEESKQQNSFINEQEANVIVALARIFHKRGKAFRIITPYDSQRAFIERRLKAEELPWEDKCFNVDSFQGHEAEHILISVVRSEKVGFLVNPSRVNVMLSRCKQSMTICTSRRFLQEKASGTLVGKLAKEPGITWLSRTDVLSDRV